jgi:endo-1,4-beta-xylanase
MRPRFSRRQFISGIAAMTAGQRLAPVIWSGQSLEKPTNLTATVSDRTSLRTRAAKKGFIYGSATQCNTLNSDPQFAKIFAEQCGILVPEGELKWTVLRPSPDSFNFGPADCLITFAEQHQMKMRGHTLVWHQALPQWFGSYVTHANAKQMLLTHVAKVVGRYSGKIHSWDVVNELVEPSDKQINGLRNAPWLKLLGPECIDTAFHACAEADPHALLVWNENWLEEETPYGDAKRKFFLEHLRELRRRGVPIQAIGIQSHLMGDHTNIAGPNFQRFLREVSDLGLKIMVTELDVRDFNLPADVAVRDRIVADKYHDYLSVVLSEKAVIAVLTWGLSDKHTWISQYFPRKDNIPVRPLPLDSNLNPKLAWNATARAFDEAPPR